MKYFRVNQVEAKKETKARNNRKTRAQSRREWTRRSALRSSRSLKTFYLEECAISPVSAGLTTVMKRKSAKVFKLIKTANNTKIVKLKRTAWLLITGHLYQSALNTVKRTWSVKKMNNVLSISIAGTSLPLIEIKRQKTEGVLGSA